MTKKKKSTSPKSSEAEWDKWIIAFEVFKKRVKWKRETYFILALEYIYTNNLLKGFFQYLLKEEKQVSKMIAARKKIKKTKKPLDIR